MKTDIHQLYDLGSLTITLNEEQTNELTAIYNKHGFSAISGRILIKQDEQGKLLPVLKVDQWNELMLSHSEFAGIKFVWADDTISVPIVPEIQNQKNQLEYFNIPKWCEAIITLKGKGDVEVREFYQDIVHSGNKTHLTHPCRNLRHKAQIQCCRVALGMFGILDIEDVNGLEFSAPAPTQNQSTQMVNQPAAPSKVEVVTAAGEPQVENKPSYQPSEQDTRSVDNFLAHIKSNPNVTFDMVKKTISARAELSDEAKDWYIKSLSTAFQDSVEA